MELITIDDNSEKCQNVPFSLSFIFLKPHFQECCPFAEFCMHLTQNINLYSYLAWVLHFCVCWLVLSNVTQFSLEHWTELCIAYATNKQKFILS